MRFPATLGFVNSTSEDVDVQVTLTSFLQNETILNEGMGEVNGATGSGAAIERSSSDEIGAGLSNVVAGSYKVATGVKSTQTGTTSGGLKAPAPMRVTVGDWILKIEVTITCGGKPKTVEGQAYAGRITLAGVAS